MWFLDQYLPSRVLILVVGEPRAGKSTLGAWLCAQADRPVILPGYEEDPATHLLPRLLAHQARLADVLVLDDRHWALPYDRQALTDRLRLHRCDLLWIDPIDSYLGDTGENDGQAVRAALESLARVARDVGCAVIAARHPGKVATNVCPGSRQWRAVPREIVELRRDAGPPETRVMRLLRDPHNVQPRPRAYSLVGDRGQAPIFVVGDPVSEAVADALSVGDQVERWMVDEALELIRSLLANGEQLSTVIYRHAEEQRLRERTVRVAARRLGVVIRREGSGLEHRSYWALPVEAPEDSGHSGTPAV